jgi:hypothetical protein
MKQSAKFDYPHEMIHLILRNSYDKDKFYGADKFESKRIKILMSKYKSGKDYHALPGHLTVNLYPFTWDRIKQSFRMDDTRLVPVQLNTLEHFVIMFPVF